MTKSYYQLLSVHGACCVVLYGLIDRKEVCDSSIYLWEHTKRLLFCFVHAILHIQSFPGLPQLCTVRLASHGNGSSVVQADAVYVKVSNCRIATSNVPRLKVKGYPTFGVSCHSFACTNNSPTTVEATARRHECSIGGLQHITFAPWKHSRLRIFAVLVFWS